MYRNRENLQLMKYYEFEIEMAVLDLEKKSRYTAETPMDFIDGKKANVMEPIFTVNMSVDSKKLSEVPLTIESYSTHTQSHASVLCCLR